MSRGLRIKVSFKLTLERNSFRNESDASMVSGRRPKLLDQDQ